MSLPGPTPQQEALIDAIKRGDVADVEMLANPPLDLNFLSAQGPYNVSPLQLATAIGNIEVINALIEKGAQLDYQNDQGFTAVHLAAMNSRFELIKMLRDKGADINIKNSEGNTPLHLAMSVNFNLAAERLSPEEYQNRIKNLAAAIMFVKLQPDLNQRNNNQDTPLHLAIHSQNSKIAETLLDEAAINVDLKDQDGNTALCLAIKNAKIDIAKKLMGKNPQVNVQNKEGQTALHYALAQENAEMVEQLLAAGADIHLKNARGQSALDLARERSSLGMVSPAFALIANSPSATSSSPSVTSSRASSSSMVQFAGALTGDTVELDTLFQSYRQSNPPKPIPALEEDISPDDFESIMELSVRPPHPEELFFDDNDELEPTVGVNYPAARAELNQDDDIESDPEMLFRVSNSSSPEHLFTQRSGQTPAADNDQDILFEQNTFNPSLNARRVPRTPVRHFTEAQLTAEQMNNYRTVFGDNPYLALAKVIKHQNEVSSATLEGKTANFQRRLDSIVPALQFAVKGAREEYRQAELTGQPKTEIAARLATFEHIQDMFMSLESLTNNKSRYTQDHFEYRIAQLQAQLKNQNIDPDVREALNDALNDVIEQNIFNKRKFYQNDKAGMGSTPFDATKESFSVGEVKKRVKIEHTNNGQDVTAMFSYSRNKLLGNKSKKIWTNRKEEYNNFRAQIQDMVNVGVSEYNKGSVDNPINLRYVGPPQPEAAIMLLMEYKKRAILEGKTFHAKNHEGKVIEITPSETFSPEERAYFMHFATQKPKFADGKDLKEINQSAGYKIFKMGVEMKKPMDDAKISDGMDRYLQSMLGKSRAELDAKMSNIGSELGKTAATNDWKDNSASKAAQFRT